jgi:hypothetical protein
MSDQQQIPREPDALMQADTPLDSKAPLEKMALALYVHAARMIKEGKSRDEIAQELQRKGVKPETAQHMLQRLDTARDDVTRRLGWRNVLIGAVVCIAGFGLIVGAFGGVADGLGAVFAWGAFLLGVYWVGRGTLQVLASNKTPST